MPDLVESKPLSGFQDVLPQDALRFEQAVDKLKTVFRRYGYAPIDTPCIYRYETLTGGKAGIDKQLFEWTKGDEGAHVALRFDLTVPLARYVAANFPKLTFPFKRYDVGKVWRGERPQKGRFREFYQCDFDVVGTTAAGADLEVALVMCDALEALDAKSFQVRINDRAILNGLLGSLELLERSEEVLRVVDKLDKIGEAGVKDELAGPLGLGADRAQKVLEFTQLSTRLEGEDLLRALDERFATNDLAKKGVERLRFVVSGARKLRSPDRFKIDLSIARGLGYYTGTVYETVLLDAPEFGSVCSGGRYDDLASYYTKNRLPGVGASVGLSRLLAAQQKLSPEATGSSASCPVLVITAPEVDAFEGTRVATLLRDAGVGAEVYPQGTKDDQAKMAKQFKYGDAKGFRLAVIVAPDELSRNAVKLKDMRTQEQTELPVADLAARAREKLS
jgi:histidyl-tRNA synthetase